LKKAERIVYSVNANDEDLSTAISELIDAYAKQNDIDKALKLVDTLSGKYNRQPRVNALKSLWNALIETKEYSKLRLHANNLNSALKKKMRFQKYLCRASLAEYGIEKCLEDFESKITDSKKDNIMVVNNALHFTSYVAEFKKNPSVIEKLRPAAEKLAEQQIYLPINIIWSCYFESNDAKADEIWSKHLSTAQWIVFRYLLQQSKSENNVNLMERLNEKLWTSEALSKKAKLTALATLVELYTANKQYDEAINAVKGNPDANIVRLNELEPDVIHKLRDGLKSEGKTFPFQLPDTRQRREKKITESGNSSGDD